jgi:hypothetical protein
LAAVLLYRSLCNFYDDSQPSLLTRPTPPTTHPPTAQLTINFVALVVAFVAAVTTGETPLNVIQLLWVNLIMDSLAALALATELPTPGLLDHRPHGRNEPLINRAMAKHILVQGAYQLTWLFMIFYGLPAHFSAFAVRSCEVIGPPPAGSELSAEQYCEKEQDVDHERANSMVFNTFIWMQMFNMLCSRRIADEYSIFRGIGLLFASVWAIVAALQVVIMVVEPVGSLFHVVQQSGVEWAVSLAIGVGAIGVSMLTRLLSRTLFRPSPEKQAAAEAARAAAPLRFREHFWQILRPLRPKDSLVGLGGKASAAPTGSLAAAAPAGSPGANGAGADGGARGSATVVPVTVE